MKKNKTLYLILAAVAVLIIVAVVAKKMGWVGKPKSEQVITEQAQNRTIVETVIANGKIQPEFEIKVSPEVSGKVTELFVHEGDSVYKGQILLKINPEILETNSQRVVASVNNAKANLNNTKARLAQTKAQFANTQKIFNRNKQLYKDKVISEAEYLTSEAAYESAKQEIEAAEQSVIAADYTVKSVEASLRESTQNLGRTTVFAPQNGIITKLSVRKGETVVGTAQMAGTELLRMADLNVMQAWVDVTEADIVNVSIGDTAEIEIDAYNKQKFLGIVSEISNSANSAAGMVTTDQVTNFSVKLTLLRESYKTLIQKNRYPFRPGMSCTVEIRTEKIENIRTVPIQSVTLRALDKDNNEIVARTKTVVKEENGRGEKKTEEEFDRSDENLSEVVYILDQDSKAKAIKVKTGIQDDQYIEIKETTLDKNAQVVVGPISIITKKIKSGDQLEKITKEKLFEKKDGKP